MFNITDILNQLLKDIENPVITGDFSSVLALTLDALRTTVDGLRERSNDRTLPAAQRLDAANRAAVLEALVRVRLYAEMIDCPLRTVMLPEALEELKVALKDGAAAHTLRVHENVHGASRPGVVTLTGFNASYRKYHARR